MIALAAYLLVVGTLVAAAAAVAARVAHLARLATRWTWAGGLALLVALAILTPLRDTGRESAMPAVTTLAPTRLAPTVAREDVVGVALRFLANARTAVASAPARLLTLGHLRLPAFAPRAFAIAWAATSLALLALLALVHLRFHRAVRRLPRAAILGATVHVSPDAGPAVLGVLRGTIVVPAWLLEAKPDEQRLTIAHEQQHLARHDPLLLLAGWTLAAMVPWHPAAWWMLSQFRLAVETDCDARVLQLGVPRAAYGAALLEITARRHHAHPHPHAGLPLGVAALAEHATQIERRLVAMTPAPITFRRTRALVLAAFALLAVTVACETRLPSAPEIERMDVASVEHHSAARMLMRSDTLLVYWIDGRLVTAADARALRPEEIATIRMEHPDDPAAKPMLRIATRSAVATLDATSGAPAVGGQRIKVQGSPLSGTPEVRMRSDDFTGLVFIDGVQADALALHRLTPDQIASMEIMKGDAATRQYAQPAAANGVIRVTTKAAAKAAK